MTTNRNPDLLIQAFLEDGPADLPDRVFDAVRSDIHRTRQRVVFGPWREPKLLTPIRFALAAAIIVFAAGVAWSQISPRLPSSGQPTAAPPTQAPSPSPRTIGGEAQLLEPGRYRIDYRVVPGGTALGPTIDVTLTGTGWYNFANFAIDRIYDDGASAGPSFVVWNITNVSVDPCHGHRPKFPAPDESIDGLLTALADQEGIAAGPLTPVTIDGYAGKYVDLTIEADITECPEGFFTWGSETEGRFAQGTGEVDRVYALDVEGRRVTFFTRVLPDSMMDDVGQLQRMIESIDIQP